MISSLQLEEKFGQIKDYWTPKIIGELNGQYVKLAKLQGEFVWHSHAEEDELFMILKGTLIMEFREQTTTQTTAGNILIVPRGVEHKPSTNGEEVWVMLFEPIATKHTGEVEHEKTVKKLEWI